MSKNPKGGMGLGKMDPIEFERPLEPEALEQFERSLLGKLKRRNLSDSFIERAGKDAFQRALVEYLEALDAGRVIGDPGGFLLTVGYWRAIDELRREERQADAGGVEALLEDERFAEPTTEELAIEDLAAEELRQALTAMSAEERQVLVLHYFEERTYLQSAEILYTSERSYRRRLAKALVHLEHLLGAPAPEVGSHRAIEIGLLAWVSLRGARVVISGGPLDRLAGALGRAREAIHLMFERRPRELATTLTVNGTGERIGAIAGGPAGKVVGGCAAAALVCAVGVFVEVPNHHHAATPPHQQADVGRAHALETPTEPSPIQVRRRPKPSPPRLRPQMAESADQVSQQPTSAARHVTHTRHLTRLKHRSHRQLRARKENEEEVQVEEEFSGIAKAGEEASAETAPSTEAAVAPAQESAAAAAPTEGSTEASAAGEGSTSNARASEEAQVEKQFGAFK